MNLTLKIAVVVMVAIIIVMLVHKFGEGREAKFENSYKDDGDDPDGDDDDGYTTQTMYYRVPPIPSKEIRYDPNQYLPPKRKRRRRKKQRPKSVRSRSNSNKSNKFRKEK